MANTDVLLAETGQPVAARQAKPAQAHDLKTIKALVAMPEGQIDLAEAKLAIDHVIDPGIDAEATMAQLDTLASRIRERFPADANRRVKLEVLVTSLAQPGPWNDYRPFSYDLDDPLGKNIRNKLLSTYLATRKGNCVSMPILLVILGQKLGLDMTLATAPEHVLAKFRDDSGEWINIEGTSFGSKHDASYQQEMGITPRAMANHIYLRPLSKRESVVVMMGTLMEFYGKQGLQGHRIAVADLALQVAPKDVQAMLQKGNAYYVLLKQRYLSQYRSLEEVPSAERADFEMLGRNNLAWFAKAEALGWVEPTTVQNASYLQHIQRTKAVQQGGR